MGSGDGRLLAVVGQRPGPQSARGLDLTAPAMAAFISVSQQHRTTRRILHFNFKCFKAEKRLYLCAGYLGSEIVSLKSFYIHCKRVSLKHSEFYSYMLLFYLEGISWNYNTAFGIDPDLKTSLSTVFQRGFPNIWQKSCLKCPCAVSEWDRELLLQTRICT